MKQSKSGFTIVELLIVIVVIGILAAITIVAYNGIQEKARMTSGLAFERQIKSKYGVDTTGSWDFDDCAGTTVKNASGTPSTDAISGTGTTWITDTPTGKGCALRFSGSSRIETQATLGSNYYVKAAWVRISAATCNNFNIISQGLVNGVQSALYAPGGCQLSTGHNGSYSTVKSTQAINDNRWHYVAAIWENSTLTLYIDGKNTASTTGMSAPTNGDAGVVAIGAHSGGNYMVGDIDNVFVAAQ